MRTNLSRASLNPGGPARRAPGTAPRPGRGARRPAVVLRSPVTVSRTPTAGLDLLGPEHVELVERAAGCRRAGSGRSAARRSGRSRARRPRDVLGVVAEVEHEGVRPSPGWMRFSRESVCTALRPVSTLSTYIVCSSGWSKPVWNFSATISTWYSSRAEAARRSG